MNPAHNQYLVWLSAVTAILIVGLGATYYFLSKPTQTPTSQPPIAQKPADNNGKVLAGGCDLDNDPMIYVQTNTINPASVTAFYFQYPDGRVSYSVCFVNKDTAPRT